MTSIHRLALVSALSGAPVFAAPFLSIGDNAELFLTTNTQVRYEDNVGLAQDAFKQDDLVYQVSPGFELSYGKKGDFKSTLAVFDQFVRYTNATNLDAELLNVVWDASYKLAKLSVGADASYRQLVQNSRDTAAAAGGSGTIDSRRNVLSGSTTSEYAFTEKTKASTGISYSNTAYAGPAFLDSEIYTIPVNYFYGISPKVDLSAGLRYSKTKVDAVKLDSQDVNFNVGARGEYTVKLKGSFDVGYTVRTLEAGSEQGIIAVNSGLTYVYSLKTDFLLNAQSGFETTPAGKSQRSYGLNLGGRMRFNDAYGASAGLGYKLIDFEDTRQDHFVTLDLGFTHTISDRVSLAADYRYQNNMSSVSTGAFAANTISFSANFRY
jgi:hypothetical protein